MAKWLLLQSVACLLVAVPAQAQVSQAVASGSPEDAQAAPPVPSEDIVVTGTSIKGVAPVGSPLVQVDQRDIQDRGVNSTAGLLATIPQLDTFGSRPVPGRSGDSPTTSPSLRNLGAGATLSLLNSHRLVGIGTLSTVADPTSLPLAAIARVEVIADGASATYGSDAVGGVINVILRKDLDGVDARTNLSFADGYKEQLYSLAGGKTWQTGSILIAVQHLRNSALFGSDRDYIQGDFRPIGADTRTTFAPLPNVAPLNAQGVPTGGPFGYDGAGFGSSPNLFSVVRDSDILPESRKWNVVLNFEQRLGDNVRLFGDAQYGNLWSVFRNSPSGDGLNFTLPSTNPYFPRASFPTASALSVQQGAQQLLGRFHENYQKLDYWGVSGGGSVDISSKWSGMAVFNYGRSHTVVDQDVYDSAAFSEAVNSTDPSTAYDPFSGRTSGTTLARIADSISAPASTQKLFQAQGSVNGALFSLPGGDVKVAVGGEYRKEIYNGIGINGKRSAPVADEYTSKRDIKSVYGELFVPLVGQENDIPLVRRLVLNAAVRHDSYSDFGSTTNPKFGVDWELVSGLSLRGTYGKSFHAPSLADLKAIDDLVFYLPKTLAPGLFTPPGGTTPQDVILLAGGNPNLQPEKARTWSVGADFNPDFAPGLKASATYFDVDYNNRVVVPVRGTVLLWVNQATIDRFITFNPTQARIDALTAGLSAVGAPLPQGVADIIVDARRTNLGGVRQKGLDYSVGYNFDLAGGRAVADVSGTQIFSKMSVTVPGTPRFDDLLTTATPTTRLRTHLGWRRDKLRLNLFWSHLSGYNDTNLTPSRRVESFDPVDLNISYTLPGAGIAKGFEIHLDAQNIFDADPPVVYSGNGASPLSSPIGRLIQVGVRAEF
jgi:iron complex outermembrane receptor protein